MNDRIPSKRSWKRQVSAGILKQSCMVGVVCCRAYCPRPFAFVSIMRTCLSRERFVMPRFAVKGFKLVGVPKEKRESCQVY